MQRREKIPMKVGNVLVQGKRFKLFKHFSFMHIRCQSNDCFVCFIAGWGFGGGSVKCFSMQIALFFKSNSDLVEISGSYMRVF
jgi:hypothetical protein